MQTNDAVKALAALAQNSRLEVFRLLVHSAEAGMPAGEIAAQIGIPPATLSFHLKELAHANLITQQRSGRSIIYRLNVDSLRELLTYLVHDCCAGHPEMCQLALLGGTQAKASASKSKRPRPKSTTKKTTKRRS